MKKLILTVFAFAMIFQTAKATDLLVEEFGLAPAYSSIAAAVAAAADGDRIIIRNRAGNIPWVENITIAKSLEFLSYTNDTFFIVQGSWTITPASGREVSIIGMRNLSGGIDASGSGTGTRTVINIFDSDFTAGNLTFSDNGLDVNIVGTQLRNGYALLRYGNVIGCDITTNSSSTACIVVSTDGSASNDYVNIVGNRLDHNYSVNSSTIGRPCIQWTSTSHFFNIRNNYLESEGKNVEVTTSKNSNAEINQFYNNSIRIVSGSTTSGYTIYCVNIAGFGASSILEVMNNIFDMANTATSPTFYGIVSNTSSGQKNIYFNTVDSDSRLDNKISGSWTVNSTNTTNVAVTIGSTGIPSGSVATDNGNPANTFYDLDLTRNNQGCYGGSYSQSNFFPLFSGSARVWFVTYPFNIRQGNTLSIQAESFDR